MDTAELAERFERYCSTSDSIPEEILNELSAIQRLYSISAEELDFKWQAYSMKMGAEETRLDLKTARDFKKDLQDALERESRGKVQARNDTKRVGATPRAGGKGADDVFGMLDGLVPNTPSARAPNGTNGSTIKRKSNFQTPASKATKSHEMSSPGGALTPSTAANGSSNGTFAFSTRTNAGDIIEQLNGQIAIPEPPEEAPAESRIKLKANTDMSKFGYKTMAMKLSEASEVLDDRIDEFRQLVQEYHKLEDSAFGNPSHQSPSEIIAVGRIASDTSEGRLNAASLVLEGSRRMGGGRRVPLKLDNLTSYNFFPGQIVALRGVNASGDYFTVSESVPLPLLNQPASKPEELDVYNAKLLDTPKSDPENTRPLTVLIAAGPYTMDSDLDFSPLHTLLDNAASSFADALILIGPFLDAEHPSIRSGDFDLPPNVSPDTATMTDVFRHYISAPLQSFTSRLPTCNVILVPSLRDAHHKHAAFPQDKFVKKELGLGKTVQCVTNPMTLSMNEAIFGMSSLDVLDMLRREEIVGGKSRGMNLYERGARNIIEQRSYLPLFPPTGREKLPAPAPVEQKIYTNGNSNGTSKGTDTDGAVKEEPQDDQDAEGPSPFLPLGTMLDTSYAKLAEILNVRPDVLITPSVLQGTVKVVESVLLINPGTLCKRKAAGTYARMIITPSSITPEGRASGFAVAHKLWERARVDIVKI